MNTLRLDPETLRDGDALSAEEGGLLYALVRATKPLFCYETGTHKGVSSAYIGNALYDNGQGTLFTADPIDWGAAKNLQPLEDRVKYHQTRGVDLPVAGDINFLFIDGFHEKAEVMAEFNYFKPHLAKDALVVFHDLHPPNVGGDWPEGHPFPADVIGALTELGIPFTLIPTFNRMAIYTHL